MEIVVTSEKVELAPKQKTLSNEDIFRRCQAEQGIKYISLGPKHNSKIDPVEEAKELEIFYEQLYLQLTAPRSGHSQRILAVWDFKKGAARVVRKKGKMDKFGYTSNKELYLEYYETMFLLENNRLQMDYHNLPITIEQAYILLLGEEESIKYAEYTVYVTLTQMGYILVKHQNCKYKNEEVTRYECICAILKNEIQGEPIPKQISASKFFTIMKCMFNANKNRIRNDTSRFKDDELPESSNAKQLNFAQRFYCESFPNTTESWPQNRLSALSITPSHLNELKVLQAYEKFHEIFDKLDVIELKTDIISPENCRKFNISFDLYLHKGFRKSDPGPPIFRLIILDPDDKFPTHDEIVMCYRQQKHPCHLLFVIVTASHQLNAFHCSFT